MSEQLEYMSTKTRQRKRDESRVVAYVSPFPDIPGFLHNEFMKSQARRYNSSVEVEEDQYVDWRPDMPWEPYLYLKADTYRPMPDLFPEIKPGKMLEISERFGIRRKIMPWEQRMLTWKKGGADRTIKGWVQFDRDVTIDTLLEKGKTIWMSLTPAETMSLWPGVKRAKGHVIMTGLGLGFQLYQVAQRIDKVKRITVIEKEQEICDAIMPRLQTHLAKHNGASIPIEVIVGDVNKELLKLSGDVALLDHFEGFGGNSYDMDRLKDVCPGIKSWWCWG
jgi:hypothetical protein